MDEYPYVAGANKSISSILQKYIDYDFKDTKIFLILCGSSMSFMENQVLGYESPLYGRRTAQFKIEPFDFFDSRYFIKNFSIEDQAITYGILGGTPQYLKQFSADLSLKDNIITKILNNNSYLFEEICKQYLIRKNSMIELPFLFNEIGKWWGSNPLTKQQEEVDIIAKDDNNMILGECKWNNKPMGLDTLERLTERSNIFIIQNKYLYLFSKSGFTKGLEDYSKDDNRVCLVEFKDICKEI